MERYFLLSKTGQTVFEIPRGWKVWTYAAIRTENAALSVDELVQESLRKPIGSSSLNHLIEPGDKVALIVDDCTRPTPRREILATLFRHMAGLGVSLDQVDIVFALGTHRPMTDEEVTDALGAEIKAQVRYHHHDAWAANLVPIGRLPAAGEVRINPVVAAANIRISIGSILPHPMNGFGGGAKNLFPGVGNFEAIRDHHNALTAADGAAFGKIQGNPFQQEINQASKLGRLEFIINAVYNAREEVRAVVAGDPLQAYEHGVELSLGEYAVEVAEPADITITSTFPYEEGPQLVKPLCVAAEVTREGGWVILYAGRITGGRLPEGLLEAFDAAYAQVARGPEMKDQVLGCMRSGRLLAPKAAMDFNSALNLTLLHLSRIKAILVSAEADETQAGRLGFLHARSLVEAFRMIKPGHAQPTVNILPSGGLVVPVVK